MFAVHVLSPVMTSFDSRWSIHTAMSLIREGDTDLDEYEEVVRASGYLTTERVGGHLYTVVPVVASLLAVPFVFALDRFWSGVLHEDLDRRIRIDPGIVERTERFVASVVVAATAVLLYLVGGLVLEGTWPAVLLAGAFAFGTSAWSTASRALWQHGPSMLLLTIALYLILLARRRPPLIQYAALPLAVAYVARPTNAISAVLLTLFVLRRYRPFALRYLLWGGLVAVPFVAFSLATYGSVLPPYYRDARLAPPARFVEALAGHLISPSRGLFVFSPVLLFALAGAAARLKGPRREELETWLVGIVLLHWLTISVWPEWWGGHSYGPRLFSDMLPYLLYLLSPMAASLVRPRGAGPAVLACAFALALSVSVFVHHRGATSRYADLWNAEPVDVDVRPARVWDWRDPQFLRRKP